MHKLVHGSWFIVHRLKKVTINHEPSTTNRKSKGFTLIEILVVLSIMAVLAGGLLYSTNNAREKGKDARRKDDLKALSTAAVAYYTDHNKYPPTVSTDPRDYVSDNTTLSPGWIPELATYLNKLPKDPLQAGLLAPLASIFENGKKIAGGSWSWLSTNQTTAQKPKGQVAAAANGNLGNDIEGASYDNWGSGYLYGTKVLMGANTGTATTMKVYINSPIIDTTVNNKFELAIYNDNAGQPSTPVTNASGQGTVTGAGLNSITFGSPVTLYANTTYWLLYSKNAPGSTTNAAMYSNTGGPNSYYVSWTFGSTPLPNNSCGAPCSQSNYDYSIYVPYTYDPAIGTYSAKVSANADDGKQQSINGTPNIYESDILDNPTGTWINCPDHSRSNYFRFSNVTIPPGTNNITSAKITFTPRTDRPDDVLMNSTTLTTFQSKLRGELALDASQIPPSVYPTYGPATEFMKRVNSTPPYTVTDDGNSVDWNISNNPPWTGATADTPDIKKIIQAIVSQPSWDSAPRHINIFWIDYTPLGTPSGPCPPPGEGRIGVSYEGQQRVPSLGEAPRLTVTWNTTAPPTTCTDPLATNFGGPLPCTYSSGSPTTGACDSKTTNVYCLRTSANQKAFVLWAMLENTNDPELVTNLNARCTTNDFVAGTPYETLGQPTTTPTGLFNYCVKSPQ